MQTTPEQIMDFWLNQVGQERWFAADDALDEEIRRRFTPIWRVARMGDMDGWMVDPAGSFALLIVLDQFSRNMFRGDARGFAADPMARRHAKLAISRGHDMATAEGARVFFYLPLTHSEGLRDQDRCVRLTAHRLPGLPHFLLHARAHREVIRRFGRFPFRNDALGRETAPAERAFLDAGGSGAILEELAA
jgi:uncharacterized protein (DUF924 family)